MWYLEEASWGKWVLHPVLDDADSASGEVYPVSLYARALDEHATPLEVNLVPLIAAASLFVARMRKILLITTEGSIRGERQAKVFGKHRKQTLEREIGETAAPI